MAVVVLFARTILRRVVGAVLKVCNTLDYSGEGALSEVEVAAW
jgi:hypothetical protein